MGVSIAAKGQAKLLLPGTPNTKPALVNGEGWWFGFGVKLTTTPWGTYSALVGYDIGDNNNFNDHSEVGVHHGADLRFQTPAHRTGNLNELWTQGGLDPNFAAQTAGGYGGKYIVISGVQDVSGAGDWRMIRAVVEVPSGAILGRQISAAHADITSFATNVHRGINQAFFTSTTSGSGNQRTMEGTGLEHIVVVKGRFPMSGGNLDATVLDGLADGTFFWSSPEVLNGGTILDWWHLIDNSDLANHVAVGGHGNFDLTGTLDNAGAILPWVLTPPIEDIVLSAGDVATLSAAELATAVWLTDADAAASALGPVTFRWKEGAGESGETTGVDAFVNVVAPAEAPFGTSATRYSLMGTHMRKPSGGLVINPVGAGGVDTQTHALMKIGIGLPSYPTKGYTAHFPNYWQSTGGPEVKTTVNMIIDKIAWKVNGTWRYVTAGLPMTITPAMDGGWTPPLDEAYVGNADGTVELLIQWHLDAVTAAITLPFVAYKNNAVGDGGQGVKAADVATLNGLFPANGSNTAVALSNTGGTVWWSPMMCAAKGGDGRPACLVIGDSIGFGVKHDLIIAGQTARGEFGYVNVGLDDNVGGKRLAYANICVPGQGPEPWADRAQWQFAANAIKYITDTYGAVPFDYVIQQHAENSLGGANLAASIVPYLTLLKTEWNKPIIQVQPLVEATSTDGFRTTANQSTNAANTYPTGDRWRFIAACEPGGSLAAGGYIQGTIKSWPYESADPTGPGRDKFAVRPFTTTLAAAFAGGGSFQTVDQVGVGMEVSIAGNPGVADVFLVQGTGPYTCYYIGGYGGSAAAGANVQEVAHGDAVHPSGYLHRYVLPQGITDWKVANGYGP